MKFLCLMVGAVAAVILIRLAHARSDDREKVPVLIADRMQGKAPGEVRDDNSLKLKLVWCPPGFVMMEQVETIAESPRKTGGDEKADEPDPKDKPDTSPQPTTKITRVKAFVTQGYWLGKYEVTQSAWKAVMKTEPWKDREFTKEGADIPATYISWSDAVDFCRKLTEQERAAKRLSNDWEYTLPTEAQWDRACRARTETRFSFGDDASQIGDYAWYHDNTFGAREAYAHSVGRKKANRWGLFDMHGNVWEWCRDSYVEKLPGGRDPEVKPVEKIENSNFVLRGGGWPADAASCRSANRIRSLSWFRNGVMGFRVALSPVRSGDSAEATSTGIRQ